MPITTLLWIGPARHFAAALAEDPRLDVIWQTGSEAGPPARPPACDVVLVDAAGEAAAAVLAARKPGDPPVAVLVDDALASTAAPWLARGASAVVTRPTDGPRGAAALVERILELPRRDEPGPDAPPADSPLVARDPRMRAVAALARRAAVSRATVLLAGETGTGKELVAREIHAHGPRAAGPFVAINCAALPDTLLESELLGHARGAFTGAERDRKGAFEEAHGGTLFLDEVGETSPAFQAKLLRVLQDRRVRPLGGAKSRRVDVRVVAATHRDLRRAVRAGRFREDLYYRLAVFPIAIPPLRERPADVLALAERFLALHGRAEHRPGCALTAAARRALQGHRWPGNARELENEILRALVLAEPGTALGLEHFSERLGAQTFALGPEAELDADEPLRETLARAEAWLLRRALERNGGRRAETARRLGLTREGLYKKMKRYGIE